MTKENDLVDCSPIEAQPWCNFVLFRVSYLPRGYVLTKQQLRKEGIDSQSSFRTLLENKENAKCIAIKQFLYDWAPPAYDYPCLWLNTASFSSSESSAPRGLDIGNRVLWIGKNYRGQDAATIDLERTRIEVTFDNAQLADEELIKTIQGLVPCNEIMRQQFLSKPFALLSYYSRHKKHASNVPLSYWKHTRLDSCYGKALPVDKEVTNKWLPQQVESALSELGYDLNSITEITSSQNEMVEKEYLFEHSQDPGVFIHLLATPHASIHPISFPPTIGDQICEHKTVGTTHNTIYLAHTNQQYGNYELVWNAQEMTYLMIIRSAKWVTPQWVEDLILKLFS